MVDRILDNVYHGNDYNLRSRARSKSSGAASEGGGTATTCNSKERSRPTGPPISNLNPKGTTNLTDARHKANMLGTPGQIPPLQLRNVSNKGADITGEAITDQPIESPPTKPGTEPPVDTPATSEEGEPLQPSRGDTGPPAYVLWDEMVKNHELEQEGSKQQQATEQEDQTYQDSPSAGPLNQKQGLRSSSSLKPQGLMQTAQRRNDISSHNVIPWLTSQRAEQSDKESEKGFTSSNHTSQSEVGSSISRSGSIPSLTSLYQNLRTFSGDQNLNEPTQSYQVKRTLSKLITTLRGYSSAKAIKNDREFKHYARGLRRIVIGVEDLQTDLREIFKRTERTEEAEQFQLSVEKDTDTLISQSLKIRDNLEDIMASWEATRIREGLPIHGAHDRATFQAMYTYQHYQISHLLELIHHEALGKD